MRIREIVKEGFFGDLKSVGSAVASKEAGKGFIQGLTGADFSREQPEVDADTLKAAQATLAAQATTKDKTKPTQGAIFLVKGPGGMEYFKNYQGIWFEKPDSREMYSASGALQIKDPVGANKLNQLLPQAQTIYVKSASPGDTINFVPDPSGRTAKLAARRPKPRVKK
jgi:hypothetical protein